MPQRVIAVVLALLLPSLVLAYGLSRLLEAPDDALSVAAQRMEDLLADDQPQVVVLGNSLVGRGADAKIIGAGLGDSPVSVGRVWEPGTRPANWYLFMANRVYANGHRPHVMVVLMAPQTLFDAELSSDLAQKSFANHVGEYEPVVNLKVFGQESPNPWLQRLRDQRGAFQEWWAATLRAASVGLFHGDAELPLLERGEAVAGPALERVFQADGAVDMALHQRVIPVVEHAVEASVESDASVVAASFVPDLLDLAEEHGTRVVFVWMPMLPETEAKVVVAPAVQAEFIRTLNERGAAYLDMSGLGYPRQLFEDFAHLGPAGKKRFSAELAAALAQLGVMDGGPFRANELPLSLDYQARLVGTPPDLGTVEPKPDPGGEACRFLVNAAQWQALGNSALSAARVGAVSPLVVLEDGLPLTPASWPGQLTGACHGAYVPQSGRIFVSPGPHKAPPWEQRSYTLAVTTDLPVVNGKAEGWFVYPGTELSFDFAGWPESAGERQVRVGLEPLVGSTGGTVSLDGQALALEATSERWLQADTTGPAPQGPWNLTVSSPADGPWLLVRHIAIGADGESVDLVGNDQLMQPPQVSFMTIAKQSEATVQGDPPRFPLTLEPYNNKGVVRGTVPGLEQLHAAAIAARVACGSCSPLRLAQGDALRDLPDTYCGRVFKGEPDTYCVRDGDFLFTSSDGSDPLEGSQTFTVRLRPERLIKKYWWVYPGDVARLPLPNLRRRELRDGASRLRLEGSAFAGVRQDAEIRIRLLVGEEPVLDESVTVRGFDDGPFERQLATGVDLRGKAVVLELGSDPDAPFLFLTAANLGE